LKAEEGGYINLKNAFPRREKKVGVPEKKEQFGHANGKDPPLS